MLQVVVEQAADGGHVDVSKAGEAAREVRGVVVRPKEAPELAVENVLGLSSVRGGKERTALAQPSTQDLDETIFSATANMLLTLGFPFQ